MKNLVTILVVLVLCTIDLHGQNSTIDSMLSVVNNTTAQDEKAKLHIDLAKLYQRVNLKETKSHAQKALKIVGPQDSIYYQALDQLGRYYFFSSELDSALYFFYQERDILESKKLESKVAAIQISIGSVLLRKGDFKTATETYLKSVKYFEKENDLANAAKCYTNLASAFAELNDYKTAIEYSLKALKTTRQLKMVSVELIVLPNLATQYLRNGQRLEALQYYKEAETLAIEHSSKRSLALVYNNLGDLYLTDQDYEKAQSYLEKAINLKTELNQLKGLEESYFNLGLIKHRRGDYKSALELYNQILPTVQSKDRIRVLQGIKDSYRSIGELHKALDFADLAQSLADSLNEAESIEKITELNSQYQTAQKENKILQLTNDNQLLQIGKIKNKYWTYSLAAALIASLVFFLLFLKNAKRKRIIEAQKHKIGEQQMVEKLNRYENEAIENLIIGQEQERKRIAQDLHDSLGSKLATLKRYIENLASLDSLNPTNIDDVISLADQSYNEVRNISHNINTGVLAEKGLVPALQNMAQNVGLSNSMSIRVISTDLHERLDNHQEIQLFRIVQELITNIIKHAEATETIIQLTSYGSYLNVLIEDNGMGFNTNREYEGIGLKNVSERVSKLKGDLNIDSTVESGTTIIIEIPL